MRNHCLALALAIGLGPLLSAGHAAEVPFQFSLEKASTTSAGVYTSDGQLVRTLWSLRQLPAGKQVENWDGLDDLGHNVPPGPYEARVACGGAVYTCNGTVGNSGVGEPMQAGTDDLISDRATGEIYTANNWEEAGQDFRKMDPDGRHLMDAKFGIRNGTPNGWPTAVAVVDGVLYCAVFTCNDPQPGPAQAGKLAGGYVIRKFTAGQGKPLPFPTATGYIRVRLPDAAEEDPMSRQTIRTIAICGGEIVVADKWTGKISRYDKTSGEPLGEFTLKAPACLAVDQQQRLWIAYDTSKAGVFELGGKPLGDLPVQAAEIVTIRLAGDRLWVADTQAGIAVYKATGPGKAEPLKTYGHKARPGEFGPLAIGRIRSFDVMPDGGFVMAQTYGTGSVVTRFAPDGQALWQQVGMEFCTNVTYGPADPDLLISSLSNAYRVLDQATGLWKFEGTLLDVWPFDRKARVASQSSGTPRILQLNGRRFYFCLGGDQFKIFRLDKDMKLATWAGNGRRAWNVNTLGPAPAEGKGKALQFCWTDTNGDCKAQPEEIIVTHDKGAEGFSCEVTPQGNILLPNHADKAVWLLPLERFDSAGNPIYDWTKLRQVLPPDDTLRGLRPMKAVPLPDGYLVLQAGDPSLFPTGKYNRSWNFCWMGGGTLSRYGLDGKRLWSVALPGWCTGVDWVPNADRTAVVGIIAGEFTAKDLYHYSPDGLLVGSLHPAHKTGWLDHNGSVSVCRNPKDSMVDVFAEESFCNRISWYRMDDKAVSTIKAPLAKAAAPGETYSTEKDFDGLLKAGQQSARNRKFAEAVATLAKALVQAAPLERPFAEQALGSALLSIPERAQEGIAHLLSAAGTQSYDGHKRADVMFQINAACRRLKDYQAALAVLEQVAKLPVAKERGYVPRAMLETARTHLDAGDSAAARKQAQYIKDYFKTRPNDESIDLCWHACALTAEICKRAGRLEDAISEMENSRQTPRFSQECRINTETQIGQLCEQKRDFAKAIERYEAIAKDFPNASISTRADAMLRIAGAHMASGDLASARKSYQAVIVLPDAPDNAVRTAKDKLAALDKPAKR